MIEYVITDRSGRHAKKDIECSFKGTKIHIETWARLTWLKSGERCIDVRFEPNAVALKTLILKGAKVTADGEDIRGVSWAGEAVPDKEMECNIYIPNRLSAQDDQWERICIRPVFNPVTKEITISYDQRQKAMIRHNELDTEGGPYRERG